MPRNSNSGGSISPDELKTDDAAPILGADLKYKINTWHQLGLRKENPRDSYRQHETTEIGLGNVDNFPRPIP
jgi:hypothetical protein